MAKKDLFKEVQGRPGHKKTSSTKFSLKVFLSSLTLLIIVVNFKIKGGGGVPYKDIFPTVI